MDVVVRVYDSTEESHIDLNNISVSITLCVRVFVTKVIEISECEIISENWWDAILYKLFYIYLFHTKKTD